MPDLFRSSTHSTTTIIPPDELPPDTVVEKALADPYLVQFEENDPNNPKRQFGFSEEIGTLTVSLFITGYVVGPIIFSPSSEVYGRRPIFIISFFVYTCFQIGCALAPNTAAMLIFRLLGGIFASAPLANSGALISDIWDAGERGTALAIFTLAPFAGPALGPIVAGAVAQGGLSWRWLFWILTIFAGACWVQIVLTIPETYAYGFLSRYPVFRINYIGSPVLLVQKATKLRKQTGDQRYYALMELQKISFAERVENILARPFKILFTEPMLLAITLYMSFVYGCIYLLFEAYPIVFTEGHHLNPVISGLMFLPLPIGGAIAVIMYIYIMNPRYERKVKECAPNPVPPEFRLEVAMIAAPFFVVSFFWFAWTSFPSISLWAPMMSGLLLGWSICLIFLGLFNYIIDAYLSVAASALAANTVVRSLFGAGFPLFATQMYTVLGPRWASSLIGFIALVMTPIPFILMKYGPTLRLKSKYAPSKPAQPTSSSAV
ncbi:major facilitator superfamily domain-containing protein [Hygrophoropsis aurantiaca]|uniref:Major facilitator superfamily domain-containing protein n=1 Tax=Hygrophoropsis aurantiaca TaxID=72124 RepID=A0ACB8AGW7_9AGAM|nr:major facilitator superfamily domain-containing protein [Hygrophoropsis aurantiaca]